MADIDYGQVQRTVQDATSRMRDEIERMSHEMQTVSRYAQENQNLDNFVTEMRNSLERIEQAMHREDPRTDAMLNQIANDLTDVKARLANVEKFALQFSQYLQEKFDAEKEDREYRAAA